MGYAVGKCMGELYSVAWDKIPHNNYVNASSAAEKGENHDESELVLFQKKCLEKQGLYKEAIEHLERDNKQIMDKLSIMVKFADYSLLLGNFDDGRR